MKKPNLPIGSTVGRAFAELTIIVAGVLIALGAQSWWERRGDDEAREDAIRALHSGLAPIRRDLERDSARALAIMTSLRRVIRGDDLGSLPDSVLIITVADAAWHHLGTSPVDFPAYRDLESSGRLGLLPDSLRLNVSEYAEALRGMGEDFEDLAVLQRTLLDPWVVREFEAARLIWTPSIGYDYPGILDYSPLLSREGRNLAAAKYATARAVLIAVEAQLVLTDSLTAMIERVRRGS